VKHGYIALVGEETSAPEVIDAGGCFLSPGLIDAHIHIESSLMTPRRFAEVVVPRGTVGVVAEPHELVNVCGMNGLRWMLQAGAETALHVWSSVPSCVPASNFEAGGARVTASDVAAALLEPGVLGLAEMMNYPGVLNLDADVWAILEAAQQHKISGKSARLDGHAAGVRGRAYQAYVNAGLESDHEAVTELEALERLRSGTWLMVRDGSAARNLSAIAPLLARLKPGRAMLVTDDADAGELLERGHVDRLLREAVRHGIPAPYAVRMVSLAPAEYWRLSERGAVTAGCVADLVLFGDLEEFAVLWTMISGRIVARDGVLLEETAPPTGNSIGEKSVRLPATWGAKDLAVQWPRRRPVIGVKPDQIYTESLEPQRLLVADPNRDFVKIAVVERHRGTGRTGIGFAHGTGLKRGALAQTVAHDHHNIITIGVDDEDMALAAQVLALIGGGAVAVVDGEVKAALELPIAGLMSDAPAAEIVAAQRDLEAAARELGCTLSNPVLSLSFLALTVIPSLKITDQGLFDVDAWRLLDAPKTDPAFQKLEIEVALHAQKDRRQYPSPPRFVLTERAVLNPLKSFLPESIKTNVRRPLMSTDPNRSLN
jgi:adenine deaminase